MFEQSMSQFGALRFGDEMLGGLFEARLLIGQEVSRRFGHGHRTSIARSWGDKGNDARLNRGLLGPAAGDGVGTFRPVIEAVGGAIVERLNSNDRRGPWLVLMPEPLPRSAGGTDVGISEEGGHDSSTGSSVRELSVELDLRVASLDSGEAQTVTLEEAEARVMRRLANAPRR